MTIQYFSNLPFGTNVYIVCQEKESLVVDPNGPIDAILEEIGDRHLVAILLTHGHIDHISSLSEIHEHYPDAPIFTHEKELEYFRNANWNLSLPMGIGNLTWDLPFQLLKDKEEFSLLGKTWKAFHTPGHTTGSLCYYQMESKIVFSGDLLFSGSVGRTDFPGGNDRELSNSLQNLIKELPDETFVYPGHGESTSIGVEKQENPFIK